MDKLDVIQSTLNNAIQRIEQLEAIVTNHAEQLKLANATTERLLNLNIVQEAQLAAQSR